MDLTRYIFQRGIQLEIVLGKISDISNQYLTLEYQISEKKSASGKTYSVIDIRNNSNFFDSASTGLRIRDFAFLSQLQIYQDDLIGSIVRYEYDKYLFMAIWLNTYAQLNIPSPVFFNVENVMNDLRMMYFGKQSEDEILNSIRKNWYDKKYQNDLRIPLIDLSKKFTDEFSIVDEPKEIGKLRDLIFAETEKEEIKSKGFKGNLSILKNIPFLGVDTSFYKSFKSGNLFLSIASIGQNFGVGNDNLTWTAQYELSFVDENNSLGKKSVTFFPSLLVKKDYDTFQSYVRKIQMGSTHLHSAIWLKAGDYIREDIQFTLNEKYEIGTIILSKSKHVIICASYNEMGELRYISVSTSVFQSDTELSNNGLLKRIKYWTEAEIDELAKKKKVTIVPPTKSCYTPKQFLSEDAETINPFQKQTIAKLSDELEAVRNKNEVLYNAFINVINAVNKKIQTKTPKLPKSAQAEVYGISHNSLTLYDVRRRFPDFDLKSFLKKINNNSQIGEDEFIMSSLEKTNLEEEEVKYFSNPDDLVRTIAKFLMAYAEIKVASTMIDGKQSQSKEEFKLHNLPLFLQMLTFSIETTSNNFLIIQFSENKVVTSLSNYKNILQFSYERQLEFFKNLVRMGLNTKLIERLRLGLFLEFKENDSWKKSLLMLNPYFTLDYELLQTIDCQSIRYPAHNVRLNKFVKYVGLGYQWIPNLIYDSYSDIPQEKIDKLGYDGTILLYPQSPENDKFMLDEFKKYDQTSLDVFNGAPLPKIQVESETDDFLSQLDEIDFSDNSLFADSIVDEVNNLDFDDPDLFN